MFPKRKPWRIVLGFLMAAAFLGGFFWWSWVSTPIKLGETKIFVIRKGESLTSIGDRLEQEGLVRSAFAFKLLVSAQNLTKSIQAGSFRLGPEIKLADLAKDLTHGTLDVWVTIPEGWRSEQIAQQLVKEGFEIDFDAWQTEIENSSLEGRLFPDTYLFPKDASQEMMIKMMKDNFAQKTEPVFLPPLQLGNFSSDQVLILASLVEREVKTATDRPIIAGILFKRWNSGWPLQVDATVQYALVSRRCRAGNREWVDCDWWPKDLSKEDLQIDSLYNTYKYAGLPPAPICNPGLASIEAVVNYQKTPYWFYLSDLDGQMHYAETLAEHNINVARYLNK